MTATAAPEQQVLKVEHAAAAVLRDGTSGQADVLALQNIKTTEGAKDLFKREAVPDEHKKEPNFTEINATLVKLNPPRPDLATISARLQEIIEGNPPAAGALGGADAHMLLVGKIAANMPGIVAAISKETGHTTNDVKTRLRGNLLGMKTILDRLLKDKEFVGKLADNVAKLEYSEEMVDADGKFTALEDKITNAEASYNSEKWKYTNVGAPVGTPPGAIEWWNGLAPADQANIKADVPTLVRHFGNLNVPSLGALQRASITAGEVPGYKSDIDTELGGIISGLSYATLTSAGYDLQKQLTAKYGIVPRGAAAGSPKQWDAGACGPYQDKINALKNAYIAATQVNVILSRPGYAGAFDNIQRNYQIYQESGDKLRNLQTQKATIDADKTARDKMKLQRDKKLIEYGNRVGTALDRSFREYYNDILLKDAEYISELDATKTKKDKKDKEDLKTKRQDDAKEILKNYLRLSYLKYSGGKVVGWDDDAIKKFVKKDLLSTSPAQMARKLLERVHGYRATLPSTYQKEIDAVLKDMGVGAGPPPVTFTNVMDEMDSKFMAELAAEEMPKVLGYAYSRGYYFDRLRMTKDQAEFMRTAYGTDFFTSALSHKDEYKRQLEAEFGKDVLTGELRDKIKQILVGKNWEGGFKRLLAALAIGGVANAGLSFLGAGKGAAEGIVTLKSMGAAAAEVGTAASVATTNALRDASAAVYAPVNKFVSSTPLSKPTP